jgi:GNAT superfamily N-acetyltransferase
MEESLSRIEIKEEGSWDSRMFFEAFLVDSEKNWLQKSLGDMRVATATLDIIKKDNSVYLNRIDNQYSGKGYARELLKTIIDKSKDHGFDFISTYIEHHNADSKNMITKLGFNSIDKQPHGSLYKLEF